MPEDMKAKKLIARYDALKSERYTFDDHWQDIADLVVPNYSFTVQRYPGEKRNQMIFDSTAPVFAQRLAGALSGLLINPSLVWFNLTTGREELEERDEVRNFLHQATFRILYLLNIPKFGFYAAMHEVFLSLVAFGTAILRNQNTTSALSFESIPLACCYVDEDNEGRVNSLFREFEYTALQARDEFGVEKLPDVIKQAITSNRLDQKFKFLQAIVPREHRDIYKLDGGNKPWASIVIAMEGQFIVHESGFSIFPFVTPRWAKITGEKYGRSPSMWALPDIKMANAMSRTEIIAAEKAADPPLMVPDDGFISPFRTVPGGLNYYRAGTQDRAEPLVTGANYNVAHDVIEKRRESIKQAYYADMFELPTLDRMTATEVQARMREKQQQLNPILARLHIELMTPIIDSVFETLMKADALPPIPPVLSGRILQVEYQSPLALAQKASESTNFTQWLALMSPIAQFDPMVASNIDGDAVAHWAKGIFNVPQRLFKDRRVVAQGRQQHEQQQQAAAQVSLAQGAAKAAKDASGAKELVDVAG